MKKVTLLLIILLFSCNVKNGIGKEISVQGIKDRTLQKCLLSGYGNANLAKEINKIDRSIYNPLAFALYDEQIDIYLQPKIAKMKVDSAESVTKVSEALKGKLVFNTCLNIYKSNELNLFAKKHIRTLRKNKELDSLFFMKNPTF